MKTIPLSAAKSGFSKLVEDTGKYRARTFRFSGKEDYLTKIKAVGDFDLAVPMKFKDCAEDPLPLPYPAECLEDIDPEDELRRLTFL